MPRGGCEVKQMNPKAHQWQASMAKIKYSSIRKLLVLINKVAFTDEKKKAKAHQRQASMAKIKYGSIRNYWYSSIRVAFTDEKKNSWYIQI